MHDGDGWVFLEVKLCKATAEALRIVGGHFSCTPGQVVARLVEEGLDALVEQVVTERQKARERLAEIRNFEQISTRDGEVVQKPPPPEEVDGQQL